MILLVQTATWDENGNNAVTEPSAEPMEVIVFRIQVNEAGIVAMKEAKIKTPGAAIGFIDLYVDPWDPTESDKLPSFLTQEMVVRVTCKTRIYRGFRTDGIYTKGNSRLLAECEIHTESSLGTVGGIESTEWQDVHISAPSIKDLVEIHTEFRQGRLKPSEDWENGARESAINSRKEVARDRF